MECWHTVTFLHPFPTREARQSNWHHAGTTTRNRPVTIAKPDLKRALLVMNASNSVEKGGKVKVLFIPDEIEIMASPGELLSEVARRAGIEIIESCGVGDCGTCEVLLRDQVSGDGFYLKSCVTKVPGHKDLLIIDTVGDAVPPW